MTKPPPQARQSLAKRRPQPASGLKRAIAERDRALAYQAATEQILRVITASRTDAQPVFQTIVRAAVSLCDGLFANAFVYDGEYLHVAATSLKDADARKFLASQYPRRPDKAQMSGRAILARAVVRMEDALADAAYDRRHARVAAWRRMVGVPMLREGKPVGAIVVAWAEPGRVPKAQEKLLRTFAEQAVIAVENARLFKELRERNAELRQSLEFQGATSGILASISSSVTDAQPVFEAIVDSVLRLFGTRYAAVFLIREEELHLAAAKGDPDFERRRLAVFRQFRASFPQRIDWSGFTGKALRAGKVSQLAPIIGNPEATPQAVQLARDFGYDAMLLAPLMREGKAIGAIGTTRPQGVPFDARQVALFEAFADQAVIAIENVRLFNETKEALEKQTATADILKVLSGSPSDTQPVFEAIVSHAARLCESTYANVFRYDGERIHLAASEGGSKEALDALRASYPAPPNPSRAVGRVIETGRVVHVEDTLADAQYDKGFAGKLRLRRLLAVPLLRGGQPVGAITVGWAEPGPIAQRHEHLLKTFADQAVIAIENVRLFNETREALDRQTATSEVLGVISSSPTDLSPVYQTILANVARLCEANIAALFLYDGEFLTGVAHHNATAQLAEAIARGGIRPARGESTTRLAALERRIVHVEDILDDPQFSPPEATRREGARTVLSVPLLREDALVGVITTWRREPRRFTDAQVALVKTFADQAVIAIENVRLFNETKEALERQTATSEILRVISGSPTNIQPALDAVASTAARLCEAKDAIIQLREGDVLRFVAHHGALPNLQVGETRALSPDLVTGRAILEGRQIHVHDLQAETKDYPRGSEIAREFGYRTILATPLMREGVAIGSIMIRRAEARPFTPSQLALMRTFADQAVIAIENVRLFNETKEALDQQKASAEVLGAISGSIADTKPVFDKILASCKRLFEGELVGITLADGETVRLVAYHGPQGEQLRKVYPLPLTRESGTGWAILNAEIAHFPDIEANGVPPGVVAGCRTLKVRAIVFAPMLFEGKGIGAIWVARAQPAAFTDKQIAQLRTFADQAVIAIQNARLVNETREALDQQKASAEVLRVISSSVADTEPVFEIILRSCERLFAGLNVGINVVGDDGRVHIAAYHGRGREELERHFPVPLSEASGSGAAIARRAVVHYPDVDAPGVPDYARRGGKIAGNRSVIFAPMLWEEKAIGAIFVGRDFTGPFSEKEIALLKTFADQAVIAIQNARLFREIQEKSAQLEVANKHKSDFLANMSHELRTPLNAIIGFSEVLSERMFGEVNEKQAEYLKDIHESGRHLLSLINDILDLSKIEAGRMELELSSFDLPGAVSNAMTLVRERAQRHGIQLGLEMDPALGEFQADERKVKQILLNLLSNAVKFTPDGGKVDVSTRKADGRIEIAVRDTGIGIAPEDHAAVFEEFKQVGRDYTRKAEGTGLGLALTKRLVELHGGEISLESEPGKGSTFTVKLPLR